MDLLLAIAKQIGFEHISELNTASLNPSPDVRKMCRADICQHYGHSWSCPPACGQLETLRKRMLSFEHGILVQSVGYMDDEFDIDTIAQTESLQKFRFDKLVRQAKHIHPALFAMACGTCTRCKRCTYPDRPCRYPDRLYPSMEACGLMVKDVCDASGLQYCYGQNTIAFTSCILF